MKKMMLAVLILCGEYIFAIFSWILFLFIMVSFAILLISYFFAPVLVLIAYLNLASPTEEDKNGAVAIAALVEILWFPLAGMFMPFIESFLKERWSNLEKNWKESQKKADEYISRKERAQGGDLTLAEENKERDYGKTNP